MAGSNKYVDNLGGLSIAGFVNKVMAGVYNYLPLGLRVLHKIENIIREEMNLHDATEVHLPILTPAELWKTSGRWDQMG